ncbi:MAG: ArsR family transcriptional regulator [Pyrinomonadaceae bacterium]
MRIRKEINKIKERKKLAQVADALGHPLRLEILSYLAAKNSVRKDVCNRDLVENLPISQATVSQHIKRLINANLLIVIQKSEYTFYSVNKRTLYDFQTGCKAIVE